MRTLDIIIIVLFIVVLTMIVGLNIVSLIDKKLGNVEIIVPPIKPNIIVKINKDDLVYKIENEDDTNKNFKEKEGFASVKQEIEKVTESKINIKNPDQSNIVEYGDYVCYKKDTQEQKIKNDEINNKPTIKCQNESLNNKFTYGKEKVIPSIGNCPKKNLPENWYEMDPSLFYKVNRPPITPIEDEMVKGYNIGTFTTAAKIFEVGRINLNNREQKYAQPNNYIL
jgi:hypothetical protein